MRDRQFAEDEWERYTRTFIARFELDDEQRNSAWRIMRDCQQQRARYLASKRARVVQLQRRLSENKSDEAEKPLREITNALRELEELKRPVVKIFEKQLKPRLDKLPTRAQRAAAAEKSGQQKPPGKRESNRGGRP